jgi:YesN/AraC family two-component response regulator
MGKLMIVEDHGVVRAGICHIIQQEENLEVVGTAENGNQALELIKGGPKCGCSFKRSSFGGYEWN